MPNQYNAAITGDVPEKSRSTNFGDGWPLMSASGHGGPGSISLAESVIFPSGNSNIVVEFGFDAAATPFDQDRNPQPSASGTAKMRKSAKS